MSQQDLAEKLHIRQPTLHALEKNPKATSSKHTLAIARATGTRHEWLESGEGEMLTGSAATDAGSPDQRNALSELSIRELNVAAMPRDLPILGAGAAGENGVFELNGHSLDHARRPPRLRGVKDAYALYICGESMAPWREHGDLVYVNPHQPVKVGEYVVVQLKPTSDGAAIAAYIKRLVRRTEGEVRLLQYNPRKEITISTKRIGAIHRIVDWSELMGF